MDSIAESRLVLLGNGQVGLGRELDLEGTVGSGAGGAMSDFLSGRGRERAPPVMPAQPRRKAHLANHPVFHLGVVDGGSRVGHRTPANFYLTTKLGGLGGCIDSDLELWTFVFLHVDLSGTTGRTRALDLDAHHAHETVARSREAAIEGTIIVRSMFGSGNLLVVAIAENDRELLVRDHLVMVVMLVDPIGNPLVANGLTRTVKATIGKEDGSIVRPALTDAIAHVIVVGSAQGMTLV